MKIALPEFFKAGEITGRLGGAKAIMLEKPVYSDEARISGAEGKVRVEIAIDEDGNVTGARAVSGPPELYTAAEKAALKSRFTVPKTGGGGAPVEGYLNYEFLIEAPNWFTVAYAITAFDVRPVGPGAVRKAFPSDWKEEHELLRRLAETKPVDLGDLKPKIVFESKQDSGNSSILTQRIEGRIGPPPIDYETVALTGDLISSLRKRLEDDPPNLWRFDLCLNLLGAAILRPDRASGRRAVFQTGSRKRAAKRSGRRDGRNKKNPRAV
jgi:TonB family protein